MTPVPRATWTAGLANPSAGKPPAWKSDGVTKRPVLALGLLLLIVHYTGAPRRYVGGNVRNDLRSLFMGVFTGVTVPEPKGDEYNFVIGWDGSIWEWAGLSQAAHCSGKNPTSIGVLFLLGEGEAPTLEMAAALLWLRQHLVAVGSLAPLHAVDQHGQHFNTGCPGVEIKKRWPLYDTRLDPSPPTTKGVPMPFRICRDAPLYSGIMVVQLVGNQAIRLEPGAWAVHSADPAVPDNPNDLPPISWADLSAAFTVVASPL